MSLGINIQQVSKRYSKTKRKLWYQSLNPDENPDTNVEFNQHNYGIFHSLTKSTQALDSVSLEVPRGEIIGLLGPNGAGKTTLAKIIATLVLPDSGSVEVNGFDVEHETVNARFSLGLVTGGERSLYWKLTPEQNLQFFGSLYGLSRSEARDRADKLIQVFGLEAKRTELVQDLSTGYKMKTAFARSLMHDPEVLILDEYNRGLDPKASRQLREYIKTVLQGEQAKTILVMTHGMEIAEDLCDRIVLIDQGTIVAEGTSTALKATLTQRQIIEVETIDDLSNGLLPKLQAIGEVEMGSDSTNVIKLLVERDPHITHQILDLFRNNNVEIANFNLSVPNLEDVFLHYTGRKLED